MRLKRIVSILLLFVLVVGLGSATILLWNRDRIIGALLARVKDRTGLDIVASGIELRLSSHLVVSFHQPQILSGQRQVAAMRELRLLVSYNYLIHQHGLPLSRRYVLPCLSSIRLWIVEDLSPLHGKDERNECPCFLLVDFELHHPPVLLHDLPDQA